MVLPGTPSLERVVSKVFGALDPIRSDMGDGRIGPPLPRWGGWSYLQRGLKDNYHHYRGHLVGAPKHPGSTPAAHGMSR